ncbi:MAG: DEAD/DEAH box helicase [Rectinemataceae bacterium]
MPGEGLDAFHPLVREWFLSRYGGPTPIQSAAWPPIAEGRHVLALAPTGSGKTLTAFLGALSRLFSGELRADRCSVLYISPLKALGEDMRRNLEEPLGGIASLFAGRGLPCPDIRVAVRSGDTSQAERRRIVLRPPSILVTTPESLCLMLDSPVARRVLSDLRLVIVDEVHALAGNKRGALLACALGRLAFLAGEFQRLALSATVRPPEAAAAFIAGRELGRDEAGAASYSPRRVLVVAPPAEKSIELLIDWPTVAGRNGSENAGASAFPEGTEAAVRYEAVVPAILDRVRSARGVLVFTDSRRRAERLAFLVNEAAGETLAWAHHGSLSREARRAVEERFKAGELGCVVATSSLELGIDIGHVDEVILAGTPRSVSSLLQRIGRSGHRVGEVSRARLVPFHGMDLVLAAAARRGVADRAIEELRPSVCPLDILAQVLLELAVEGPRRVDELYDIVLSFSPFERLSRPLFDSVVEMLAGRYEGARLRELEPRAFLDRSSGLLVAKDGARNLLYSSGGAIPDRGLYSMRIASSRTKVGELDEEFVWERRVGESFTLGAQTWRIVDIGSEAVEVVPAPPDPDIIPFWKGEARFRSPELSARALELLDELGAASPEEGIDLLVRGYGFSAEAAKVCVGFVDAQRAAGRGVPSLPGGRRVVLEVHADPTRRGDQARLVLHTLRGRAVNEPLALAIAAAWEAERGVPIETVADDDWILFVVPGSEGSEPATEMRRILSELALPGRLDDLVRLRLEGSGLFGAQFRENAGRALLLPRGLPGKRMPLWMTRLRARKLFEAVRSYSDFPVVVESWRACLVELLDPEAASALVQDIVRGRVELSVLSTRSPSPFAREAVWKETGEFMYRGDELRGGASSSVSSAVVEEALRSARLRPRLEPLLVEDFVRRIKRLLPGWGAADALEFAEWVKERVALPVDELPEIVEAASPELAAALAGDPSCGGRLERMRLPGAEVDLLVHAERSEALAADPGAHLAEWLRREGPVSRDRIGALFGFSPEGLEGLLAELEEEGTLVLDALLSGSEETMVVDSQNLEILLRRSRAAKRPRIETRPASDLLRFVVAAQRLGGGGPNPARAEGAGRDPSPSAALGAFLDRLAGAAFPARLLESEVLPARLPGYRGSDLDELFAAGEWSWFGAGRETIALCRTLDLGLFVDEKAGGGGRSRILGAGSPPLDFWSIKANSPLGSRELVEALWAEAWRARIASDSYVSIREGIGGGFGASLAEASEARSGGRSEGSELPFGARRRLPRALRERWRGGPPLAGRWFSLDFEGEEDLDPLDEESLAAERVRALLLRYGILCRSILEREAPSLRWGALFSALRRLELAGELFEGRFFEGIEGPQFMGGPSLGAFRDPDGSGGAETAAVWINVLDPLASALYAIGERPAVLPPRSPSNRLCLLDGSLAAASRRSWRSLDIALPPEDPAVERVLAAFLPLRRRALLPERRIAVEEVNGEAAAQGPYSAAMLAAGFERDRGRMVMW